MWRVPSERITLDLDGPVVQVEPIRAWAISVEAIALMAVVVDAGKKGPAAEYAALNRLYNYVIVEGQPSWDVVDHRGPVPCDVRGFARLPIDVGTNLPLGMVIAQMWIDTFKVEKPEAVAEADAPTAVDAVIKPGKANTELKRRLAAARRRNARKAA